MKKRREKRNMNKKTFIGLNAFVALLLAWFAFQMYDINQKKEKVKKELNEVKQQLVVYENKKKTLEDNQKNLNNSDKTEKLAREVFNLKRKGETTYKIIE
jgi:putative cell division protein DIVIC